MSFKNLGDGRYEFKVSAWTAKGPRKKVAKLKCKDDKQAIIIEARLKEEKKAEIDRSLKLSLFKNCFNRYFADNPKASWLPCVKEPLLNICGDMDIYDGFRGKFIGVVDWYRNTPNKTGKLQSASTVNKFISLACTVLNHCIRHELIDRNPLTNIKRLSENERAVYVHEAWFDKLAEYISPSYLWPMITQYRTGARGGEVIKLELKDVVISQKRIFVRPEICKVEKGKKLPIADDLLQYCLHALKANKQYLFEINGRPLMKDSYETAYRRAAKLAAEALKVPEIANSRPHDLRGTFGTNLFEAGVSPKIIMDILGQYSERMFIRYLKVKNDSDLDKAIEQVTRKVTRFCVQSSPKLTSSVKTA